MPENKINRLILLGNGFDLAHQLKTSYNDFIVWFLTQAMEQAQTYREYSDPLVTISYPDFYGLHVLYKHNLDNVPAFMNFFYEKGFTEMINESHFEISGWNVPKSFSF